MDALERFVARGTAFVGALVLMAMMLQITIDVFMRNVIGAGFPTTADIVSGYYMVAISFLPLAMTQIADRHIEATIFTDRLRGRSRQAVLGLGIVLGIVVFSLIAYGSGSEAMKHTARRAYIAWPTYWILPVSAVLMLVIVTFRLIRLAQGRLREVEDDALEEVSSDITDRGESQ